MVDLRKKRRPTALRGTSEIEETLQNVSEPVFKESPLPASKVITPDEWREQTFRTVENMQKVQALTETDAFVRQIFSSLQSQPDDKNEHANDKGDISTTDQTFSRADDVEFPQNRDHLSTTALLQRINRDGLIISAKARDEIEIKHYDKFGNELAPKEAYKELSRKFHGTRPSKRKVEKAMLRKLERQQ